MNLQSINASASPETQSNENFETLDWGAVFGKNQPDTTGLTWGYYGGVWGGISITEGTVTLTNAATNYVVVNRATGAVSTATSSTNWDDHAAYARLYKLTTAGSVVTATEDHRAGPFGPFAPRPAHVNTTAVGNVGSGEDDLITYSLAAGSLGSTGRGIHVIAWGTATNNANAKTLKLYFGAALLLTTSLTANQAGTWRVTADIVSLGGSPQSQAFSAQLLQGGSTTLVDVEGGTTANDEAGAITVKCTGEATSNNDIVQQGLVIQFLR